MSDVDTGCNPIDEQEVAPIPFPRCTAGRTRSKRKSEGGIVDTDLAELVRAWPTLPATIRAAVLAVVRSAEPTH